MQCVYCLFVPLVCLISQSVKNALTSFKRSFLHAVVCGFLNQDSLLAASLPLREKNGFATLEVFILESVLACLICSKIGGKEDSGE